MLTEMKLVASRTVLALIVLHIAFIIPYVTAVETNGRAHGMPVEVFNRVATFDVPGMVAEIVASTPDGELLIYTDSTAQAVGFVTVTDPKHPTSAGSLAMPGEPTSVAVTPDGAWALVAIHAATQNVLVVVALTTRTISATIPLGGQPD
jgi:DNA-binding beta-propeller fold protein YncE